MTGITLSYVKKYRTFINMAIIRTVTLWHDQNDNLRNILSDVEASSNNKIAKTSNSTWHATRIQHSFIKPSRTNGGRNSRSPVSPVAPRRQRRRAAAVGAAQKSSAIWAPFPGERAGRGLSASGPPNPTRPCTGTQGLRISCTAPWPGIK